MSDGGSISDIRKRTRTEEADDPVSVFLSGNDLFDFGRNVVGSNVWFPNSYFFGCGRDVHAAACIFEQKPAKNSSRVFYRTILSVSSHSNFLSFFDVSTTSFAHAMRLLHCSICSDRVMKCSGLHSVICLHRGG